MKIKILSQFDWQKFPIVDGMIEVSEEDLQAVRDKTKCFDIENQCVIPYEEPIDVKAVINKQIIELKQKLFDTDYQAIKYAEGQLSEEEYSPMKLQRQEWRNQINELEKEI